MNNAILKTKYLFLSLVIIFTFSCKGDDGEIGPKGDPGQNGIDGTDGINGQDGTDGSNGTDGTNGIDGQDGTNGTDGTNGADGQDGTNGTNGTDGQDGNANVMSSDWFIASGFTLTTGFGDIKLLDHDHAAPEITQEIIDTGVVLVYGNLRGYTTTIWPFNQVSLLPITLMYGQSPTNIDTWTAILSAGNIKIRFINNNNTYSSIASVHRFRYVIIPSSGSTSGRIAKESIADILADAGVDINNLDEVLAYYGK